MRHAFTLAGASIMALAAYERLFQPWQERWGTTEEEVAAALPGDDLTAAPAFERTRAITIDVPPTKVWPWIVQLGADRGGFYSYDWLENIFGLDIHNADEIVPAWQHLTVGDWCGPTAPRPAAGSSSASSRTRRSCSSSLTSDDGGRPDETRASASSSNGRSHSGHTRHVGTRLLVRERVAFGRRLTRLLMAPIGIVSFGMTRKMLLGIKQRAERDQPVASSLPHDDDCAATRTVTLPAPESCWMNRHGSGPSDNCGRRNTTGARRTARSSEIRLSLGHGQTATPT